MGSGLPGSSTDPTLDAHINRCRFCQDVLDGLAAQDVSAKVSGDFDPDKLPRIPGFTIGRELGRGGMGVVFLAHELQPDREVAVKFLSSGPFAAPRDRDRWLKEARAAARVRHPHIVQLYQVGEADGWLYLVLEYLAGGSLKERLTGPLSPRVAATLLVSVARALSQLHLAGVWHLDLKPANILIDAPPGTPLDRAPVKLADFGIARLRDDVGTTGSNVGAAQGTLLYMAPEQLDGRRSALGPATDIYAMGVILYELLAGRPPFLTDGDAETIRRIQSDDPVPPRRLNPAIPRDLETIILTCLCRDPARRYACAEALAEDLRRWLDGSPILARPVSALETAWTWCRRRPVVAALVATLALTLSSGFLGSLLLWRYADAQRVRAEGERARAEADYEIGRAALAEILDLEAASLKPTVIVTRGRVIRSLQATRERILQLAGRRPNDPANLNLLAHVDLLLRKNLEYERKWREAESLHAESLRHWDMVLAKTPADLVAMYRRWQTLWSLGQVFEAEGNFGESLRYWERAIIAGESVWSVMPDPDFSEMAWCRINFAKLLAQLGSRDRERTILKANIKMLKAVPAARRSPVIDGLLRESSGALYLNLSDPDTGSNEEWARRVVRSLEVGPDLDGHDAIQVSEAAYLVQKCLSERASTRRRAGKLAEARRTVDRMHALGHLLVSARPEHSAAHLALSEAFRQSAKDAWETIDRAAVERNWRQALDEARQGLLRDAQDTRANDDTADLERRLRDLSAS